jgi:hypothetical protein
MYLIATKPLGTYKCIYAKEKGSIEDIKRKSNTLFELATGE